MNEFISIATPPPSPGWYWTAVITRDAPDRQGVIDVHYSTSWRVWDGKQWQGGDDDQPTHWYGEAS